LVDVVGTGSNPSYITVDGFEVYNYTTTNDNLTPAGIHVEGSGTNIQLLNNYIHHIWNTGKASTHDGTCGSPSPQAFGLVVVGTVGTSPLTNLTVSGNTLTDLKTGCSESLTVNGNIKGFTISHNSIHNKSNAAKGSPPATSSTTVHPTIRPGMERLATTQSTASTRIPSAVAGPMDSIATAPTASIWTGARKSLSSETPCTTWIWE
jgi:hypothetical protein